MEELIKQSYDNNDAAKTEVDEGKYDLLKGGTTILRQHWDLLVRPWSTITIQLHSQKTKVSDAVKAEEERDTKAKQYETIYERKVAYRINYLQREKYGSETTMIYSAVDDEPTQLAPATEKLREQSVLEEVQTVTFKHRDRDPPSKASIMMEGPNIGSGDQIGRRNLRVCSHFLLNALRAIAKYSAHAPTGDDNDAFKDGIFPYPYQDLFHLRDDLEKFKKQTSEPRDNHTKEYNIECDSHIELLIEYLHNEPNVQLSLQESKWANKVPTTTFAGFWLLMKPGTDVYIQENGMLNTYIVDSVSGGVDYLSQADWITSARSYIIVVWNLIFDGKVIKRKSKHIRIPVFDGDRDIMSLLVFPTRFQDKVDNGKIRWQLIQRGKRFFASTKGPTFLEYTGLGQKPGWKKVGKHLSLTFNGYQFSVTARN
jgi:hypothetical protein